MLSPCYKAYQLYEYYFLENEEIMIGHVQHVNSSMISSIDTYFQGRIPQCFDCHQDIDMIESSGIMGFLFHGSTHKYSNCVVHYCLSDNQVKPTLAHVSCRDRVSLPDTWSCCRLSQGFNTKKEKDYLFFSVLFRVVWLAFSYLICQITHLGLLLEAVKGEFVSFISELYFTKYFDCDFIPTRVITFSLYLFNSFTNALVFIPYSFVSWLMVK
jgi:hypothetical protein